MSEYDIGIIGAGMAGVFAAYKIAKEHKNKKVILFDLGRPPQKRRRQLEGFLGVLPNSDGKLYINDKAKISKLVGTKKTNNSIKYVNNILSNINKYKITKDKSPSVSTSKKLNKHNYSFETNDYIQMFPKEIHALSKMMSKQLDESGNIQFSFDNEVFDINKQKNKFVITTEFKEFFCDKILIAAGRSGWRWVHQLYSKFGIVEENNTAKYGIRIELPATSLKDFNKSNLTITKGDLEIGPFSWGGTVIPEDHVDLAISSFRSNENRWKTDKVSFNFIGHKPVANNDGCEQTDRIGKLTFLIANDRIVKEKVSSIISEKSKISIMKEYNWLIKDLKEFSTIIPDLLTKAYFHVPTILPMSSTINIGDNMETEISGLFVAGESAGISGLLSAAATGVIAAEGICK